jgi:hypothetical protein
VKEFIWYFEIITTYFYHYCNLIWFCFNIFYLIFKGGKSSRVVNCVLALKSYSEWKLEGKNGLWKYGGNPKPQPTVGKTYVRKNSIPFMRSLSRGDAVSLGDKDGCPSEHSSSIDAVLNDCSEEVISY